MIAPKLRGQAALEFFVFGCSFVVLLLTHLPLLRLPYFWDEAGYYVPAARDLLLHGTLIPQSTPSNAHPPLVMAWLSLCWRIAGFSVPVTRTAMLLVAAFSLTGLFRLARSLAGIRVAIATLICTALYPVFFVQSSLAQVDLAAAGLLFWGLAAYLQRRCTAALIWFSAAVLAKETAVLVLLALCVYDLLARFRRASRDHDRRNFFCLLAPGLSALPLIAWYAYHFARTGFVFGNPEFFRYNVQATISPLRMVLALLLRIWQLFGYLNLCVLTVAVLLALAFGEKRVAGWNAVNSSQLNWRPLVFAAAVYVMAMSVVGGAVLARYMLPLTPLVILAGFAILKQNLNAWQWLTPMVAASFVLALCTRPPYGTSLEDNLAYRDCILLHQRAEAYLESHYPHAHVLTAWPATDELTQPYLGYVRQPFQVAGIEDFTLQQLEVASSLDSYDTALVFSTKLIPSFEFFGELALWRAWKTRYFGFHVDLPPAAAANLLGGNLVFSDTEGGQWIAIIQRRQAIEATTPLVPRLHQLAGVGFHDKPHVRPGSQRK